MRGAPPGVRQEFGVSSFITPSVNSAEQLRIGAIAATGIALGVFAALAIAPTLVSANDDAGIRSVQMQDARERNLRRAAPAPMAPAPAPRVRDRFEMFQPVVRSFAPQPRPSRALPPPIQFGYGADSRPAQADAIRPLGPLYPSMQEATSKRRVQKAEAPRSLPSMQSTRTMCVRLCDGYAFPVGTVTSGADWNIHANLCQAACPAAETRLYSLAPGAMDMSQAVARDGARYASLSTAFAFRQSRIESCTCQTGREGKYTSLLRDVTLRAGDAVVVGTKAKVFRGSSEWPYRQKDFADFRSANQLSGAQRRQLDSMTAASLNVELLRPFTVAKAPAKSDEVAVVRPETAQIGPIRDVKVESSRPILRSTQGFTTVGKTASSLVVVEGKARGFIIH